MGRSTAKSWTKFLFGHHPMPKKPSQKNKTWLKTLRRARGSLPASAVRGSPAAAWQTRTPRIPNPTEPFLLTPTLHGGHFSYLKTLK